MDNLTVRLRKIGWEKKDIDKAALIIHNAKQLKTQESRFFEARIYWILLVLIIAANFAVSVAMLPLLVALNGATLYSMVIVLGIIFGLLFELVIRSVEHLEKKHHILLAVIIPLAALANLFVITNISNTLKGILSLQNFQNPIILALVYSVSFVTPYILYRFVLKIEYYSN